MNDGPASSSALTLAAERVLYRHGDHVANLVALSEGGDSRDQRLHLGLISLEHLSIQRKPVPAYRVRQRI